ncbi:MAG TPA: phosphatase PAP2 family protein [Vicinamibacterales bacterium]|nr:phosphatase PAP2 family protein [Vicinamibacterales bacterium]
MRVSEWVALLYFAYLALAAIVSRAPVANRVRTVVIAAICAAAVRGGATTPSSIRNWLPAVYILAGYYVAGWLFVAPAEHLEAWLMAWDRRLLGDPTTRFRAWPRVLVSGLEVIYMGCFLLVPGGFALLAASGHADLADRYWTLVTAAEFGAFAPLSFFQTRPPWALERKPVLTDPALHEFATNMVQTMTIRVNTFPSGHAAGSLAVAFAVLSTLPIAGSALLLLAVGIGLGCFVCRYHYVVDVIAGAALAIVLWGAVSAFGV